MDTIDEKIDRIWEKVYEENPDLINDWIQCFSSSSYREGKDKSKEEIKMTLSRNEYQIDPRKNFLWRLMSKDPQKYGYADPNGERKRRGDLAMLFTQVIIENSYWKNFIATTLALRAPEPDYYGPIYCSETTTLLHNAARFENVEGVKKLLAAGERMQINPSGYTPLHFAAMAINPKPEIAKLLINSANNRRLLNEQTNDKCGRNTALHIAAANVKVTEEFIQHFKDADPLLRNSKNDTPFHVAAKSSNPQAIIYMLNTFEPTNKEWDVDEVDYKCQNEDQNIGQDMNENQLLDICARLANANTEHNEHKYQHTNNRLDIDEADQPEDTLIKICARAGNAEAVELLIKHGADIAQGVLHEIVIESVRNPEKINDLLRVYQSIVDNAVTWRNLEEDSKFLTVEGSEDYAERFRKTMIWLLTTPNEDYGREDALQCALTHGASRMFWSIINTKSVFRMDGKKASSFVNDENESKNVRNTNWTVFDVTNFTRETMLKPNQSDSDSGRQQQPESQQISRKPATEMPSDEEGTALCSTSARNEQSQQKPNKHNEQNNFGNKQRHERNFDVIRIPQKPYLDCVLSEFHLWKSSNVLSTQPFNELTRPYIRFVQRFYLVLGLLQLVFMTTFSVYWMPNICSLAVMFNVSTTGCSTNSTEDSFLSNFSQFSQQRSWIAMLWLIWPLFLIAENAFITYHYIIQSRAAHTGKYLKSVLNSKDQSLSFLSKLMTSFLRNPALRVFCIMMLVWLHVYFKSESLELYIEVTSMVFLFGWITNLSFFGAVSKNVSISKSVVDRIIIKDISSFMLFFGFNVVGFSFAMHTIRMSVCMASQDVSLHDTFFAVLSSAFGIGDFFDATTTDATCVATASTETLFEFVYLGYICTTMIVLLNILIAMINSRYEKAKRKAENIWRFETLSTMIALKSVDCSGCSKCCKKLLSPAGLSFNKEFNRYYLRLLLPVDQRLLKLE